MTHIKPRSKGDACIAPTVVFLVTLFSIAGSVALGGPAEPMGPLVVCPANSRYFQNAATGEVVLLTGSHTWPSLVDMGTTDPPPAFDFDKYLDWMSGFDHDFIRLWTWELVTWDTSRNGQEKKHTVAPLPYARTGPGKALDGKPRFDLTKFDPEYFERLKTRVAAAREHGIYVSVMLFEGWGPQFASGAWEGHPFNPRNNVNGIDGDTNGDGRGVEIHELGNEAVTAIQEAYVRKVIDTVNGFDNVLYEISNENHPPSTAWQYHMIRFVKACEATKPMQHPVGMTFQYKGGKNETLFDSPADWISPNPDGGYRDDPPAADGRKVVVTDTDHLWGIGGSQTWVWKSFMRGLNPIFMDPYDGEVLGPGADPRWDAIRKNMGYARQFAQRMDLARAVPAKDIASTGYCLAEAPKRYLVFRPEDQGDSFSVRLPSGTYTCEWFDPGKGEQVGTETVEARAGTHEFRAPFAGDAVLLITRMLFPGSDWKQGTPPSQGVDAAKLDQAMEYLRDHSGGNGVKQAMVVRNGYVIWQGSEVDKVHGIWSCTKSFTSTVLGLLIEDGKATLDTLAKDYVPAMASAYPKVTLRHFTTMTSGYHAVGDEPRGTYRHGPSRTPFDPCDTPLFAPGTQYAYWDSAMNQFGNVLTHIAGEPMAELFRRRIAEPIGMDPGEWRWGDFGTIDGLKINGGAGNSGNHIFISARQMARFGLLFLNGGTWNGKQLIDGQWVRMATRAQVPTTIGLWPDSAADGRGVYGFNWWTNGIEARR